MKTSQLLALTTALNTKPAQPFATGDVVVWKNPALRMRKIPNIGQPVVISRVLAEPLASKEENDNDEAFGQAFDMVIAAPTPTRAGDIGIAEYHMDSRHFRLATQEEIDTWDALPDAEKFPGQEECGCRECAGKRMLAAAIGSISMIAPGRDDSAPAAPADSDGTTKH